MQLTRIASKQQLWEQPAATDTASPGRRSVVEQRERSSVSALLRGHHVLAKEQLIAHLATNSLEASRQLLESSRRLLEQSRRLILKAENALVFSGVSRRKVN